MKKRLLMLTMASMLAFGSLCACGSKSSSDSETKTESVKEDDDKDREDVKDEEKEEPKEEKEEPKEEEKEEPKEDMEDPEAPDEDEDIATVESYYNQPEVAEVLDESVESLEEAYGDYYSDIDWKAEGNTLTYIYQFATDVSGSDFSTTGDSLEATSESQLSLIHTETGVPTDVDITIEYIYLNFDGTEVAHFAYTG